MLELDTKLSDEEELTLKGYSPDIKTKYSKVGPEPEEGEEDTRPISIEVIDNRDLAKHKLYIKKILKKKLSNQLLKEFPLHKQLNFSILSSDEQTLYKGIRAKRLAEYELKKAAFEATTDIDTLQVILNKQVIEIPNWLTLGLTSKYKLED